MTPERAKELIQEYADVNRKIKDTKSQIGSALDKCQGISGNRKDGYTVYVDENVTHDSKGRDLDLHLTYWYKPMCGEDYEAIYEFITEEEHGIECRHCYAAHLLIQDRKKLRKMFGTIKGIMSRSSRTKEGE